MCRVPLQIEIHANKEPLKVHFSKIKTANDIKVSSSDGQLKTFSGEKLKQGLKNTIVDLGKKIKITLTPPSQFYHLISTNYRASFKNDW